MTSLISGIQKYESTNVVLWSIGVAAILGFSTGLVDLLIVAIALTMDLYDLRKEKKYGR